MNTRTAWLALTGAYALACGGGEFSSAPGGAEPDPGTGGVTGVHALETGGSGTGGVNPGSGGAPIGAGGAGGRPVGTSGGTSGVPTGGSAGVPDAGSGGSVGGSTGGTVATGGGPGTGGVPTDPCAGVVYCAGGNGFFCCSNPVTCGGLLGSCVQCAPGPNYPQCVARAGNLYQAQSCSPDGLVIETPCPFACANGVCVGVCVPGQASCIVPVNGSGQNWGWKKCDGNGQWQTGTCNLNAGCSGGTCT